MLLTTFNPPLFQVCGNNADDIIPHIGDCIRENCLTKRQLEALEKRGKTPRFVQRTDVRSEEPVFELDMPMAFFDEVKQSAFFVSLLNKMEAFPQWRPFIGDATYSSGQTHNEEVNMHRQRMMQFGSGNRIEVAVKKGGKQHHLLFFTHT